MIISCRECNGKVSTEAKACPHCGVPTVEVNHKWASIAEEAEQIRTLDPLDAPLTESTIKTVQPIYEVRHVQEVRHIRHDFPRRVRMSPPSVTWKAFAALVLYWVFWIPGFAANILFLQEAKSMQRRTGRAPEGMGCLAALLWMNITLVIIGMVAFLVLVALPSGIRR